MLVCCPSQILVACLLCSVDTEDSAQMAGADPPTCPYLPVLVRKSAGSVEVSTEIGRQCGSMLVFLKIQTQSFQKVRKSRCETVANETDRRVLMGSYGSLIFVYSKPFPGLKYTAGPDWSNKFVKPMNIDFASKLYGS